MNKFHLRKFYNNLSNDSIKYRLVIDTICEKFGFNEIRKLLYFINNLKHGELVEQSIENI